jgi:hypothetical protein
MDATKQEWASRIKAIGNPMKLNRFVYRMVSFNLLALGALIESANAGLPGKCLPPIPTCDVAKQMCGKPGTTGMPCLVRISETSGAATAAAQNLPGGIAGSSQDPVCVMQGTKITWFTLEDDSSFNVTFGVPHPFAHTIATIPATFNGNDVQSPTDKANRPGCYQYSIVHCLNGPDGPCTIADPKVIVNGVVDNAAKESVKK